MSLQGFRTEAEALVVAAVMGGSATGTRGKLASMFNADVAALRAGETGWQLRVWCESQDAETDSNVLYDIAIVEITVARKLLTQEDEALYLSAEMLASQTALVNRSAWSDLNSVFDVESPPAVDAAPERTEETITYTVSVTLRLNP